MLNKRSSFVLGYADMLYRKLVSKPPVSTRDGKTSNRDKGLKFWKE